jgi:hypothetical protein
MNPSPCRTHCCIKDGRIKPVVDGHPGFNARSM